MAECLTHSATAPRYMRLLMPFGVLLFLVIIDNYVGVGGHRKVNYIPITKCDSVYQQNLYFNPMQNFEHTFFCEVLRSYFYL